MLVPNDGRIIVELIKGQEGQIVLPDRDASKIGENAQIGKVVHCGASKFKNDQLVVFSEYSAVGVHKDFKGFLAGEVSLTDIITAKPEDMHFIIAEMDVMAFEE